MSNPIEVEEASGNVFADIGLLNPEERLAKADLAIRIDEAIRARRLTQSRAAHILGIDQPKISRLLRGQLSGFSTERLMHFLTLLGRDVEITVKPAPRSRRQGHLRVVATAGLFSLTGSTHHGRVGYPRFSEVANGMPRETGDHLVRRQATKSYTKKLHGSYKSEL